jgi:hypothetical protein
VNVVRIVAVLAFVLSQLLGGGLGVRLAAAAPGAEIAADAAKGTPAVARTTHHPLHRVFVHAPVVLPRGVAVGDRAGEYRLLRTSSHTAHVRTCRRTGTGPRAPPR